MKIDRQPIRDPVPWNSRCTKDPRWLNNVFLFSTEIWTEQLKKHPVCTCLCLLTTTWIQRIAGPFNTSRQRWNWKVLTHKIFKHSECLEGFCGDASMYFVNRHKIQKNISNGTKYFCKSNCQLQILNFCGSFASALVQTSKNWHYHFNSPSFQAFHSLFWGKGCFEKNKN